MNAKTLKKLLCYDHDRNLPTSQAIGSFTSQVFGSEHVVASTDANVTPSSSVQLQFAKLAAKAASNVVGEESASSMT